MRASAATLDGLGPRVLVHFHASATAEGRAHAIAAVGATVDVELPELATTRLAIATGQDAGAVADVLMRDPAVASAEADLPARLAFTPNDPYWNTDPITGLGQWSLRRTQVDKAWDVARASSQIIVAVIDTGVDAGHPDLANVVLPGATFLSNPSPTCAPSPAQDDNSHGTHVAGIIGANANDGVGIAGVAFGVRILPLKVLDCTGTGSLSDIARAIVFAADHGAKIINISLGSPGDGQTLHDAVRYATGKGALVVAAAGNCGVANPVCAGLNQPDYPAAYAESFAVGATTSDDVVASFSTQGPEIAVSAPGVRIVSTTPRYPTYQSAKGSTPNYAAFTGTSQAAPLVSGIAALVWSADPTLTASQVATRIRSTADDLGVPGADQAFGAGRVNAFRAVSGAKTGLAVTYDTSSVPRQLAIGTPSLVFVKVTNASTSVWSAAGPAAVRFTYRWLDAAGITVVADGIRQPLPMDIAPGATISIPTQVTPPTKAGQYTLHFDLVRDDGSSVGPTAIGTNDVRVGVGNGLTFALAPMADTYSLATGSTKTLPLTVTNNGVIPWTATGPNQVRVSYHWLATDGSMVVWDGARAPQFAADVQPGQSASVALTVTPPPAVGSYILRIDFVQEGVAWFSQQGAVTRDLQFTITNGYGASYAPAAVGAVLPGGRFVLPVVVRNTGVSTWASGGTTPVRVSSHVVDALGKMVSWDGVRTALVADLAPGGTISTAVTADAPLTAGSYRVRVDLVQEGVSWFSGLGVAPMDAPVSVISDYRATLTSGPLTVSRATGKTAVTITNTSLAIWSAEGAPAPVRVAPHWYDAAGNALVWDGPRTFLSRDLAPGESITLVVALGEPPAGAASVTIDLVADGLRWFGAGTPRPVTVTP